MIEVGGKLKTGLLLASVAVFGALAFSARTSDLVKIKGEACEKFVPGQSKSSIRVRVTDKASYNAVSQIPNLAEARSNMLEHDFNVIVYNLVDNYVRDLMVRTTSQNDDELCVKVTGAIPVSDIDQVIANYSPNTPAPEYDIKEAAGIEEEVLTPDDDVTPAFQPEPEAEVLYNGIEEQKSEEQKNQQEQEDEQEVEITDIQQKVVYTPEMDSSQELPADNNLANNNIETDNLVSSPEDEAVPQENILPQNGNVSDSLSSVDSSEVQENSDSLDVLDTNNTEISSSKPKAVIDYTANVYVGPVEFNNNTHSAKPSQVLKDMFADTDGYRLVDNPQSAIYAFYPKVLKAKVEALNSQTKRIQMVVSLQLQVKDSNISYSEHQNRFVLFESTEKEQDIAQKLLHKLLRKAGRKLFDKVEQEEQKRKAQNQ